VAQTEHPQSLEGQFAHRRIVTIFYLQTIWGLIAHSHMYKNIILFICVLCILPHKQHIPRQALAIPPWHSMRPLQKLRFVVQRMEELIVLNKSSQRDPNYGHVLLNLSRISARDLRPGSLLGILVKDLCYSDPDKSPVPGYVPGDIYFLLIANPDKSPVGPQ
jgi:hypothetical protein